MKKKNICNPFLLFLFLSFLVLVGEEEVLANKKECRKECSTLKVCRSSRRCYLRLICHPTKSCHVLTKCELKADGSRYCRKVKNCKKSKICSRRTVCLSYRSCKQKPVCHERCETKTPLPQNPKVKSNFVMLRGRLLSFTNKKNIQVARFRTIWFLKLKDKMLPLFPDEGVSFKLFVGKKIKILARYHFGKKVQAGSKILPPIKPDGKPIISYENRGYHVRQLQLLEPE